MRNNSTLKYTDSKGITKDGIYVPYGAKAYVQLQGDETPSSPNMTYNGDGSITFKGVNYYINNAVGWWRNKSEGANAQNVELKPNKTIVNQNNNLIKDVTYTINKALFGWLASVSGVGPNYDFVRNLYIGSWICQDQGQIGSITVNKDMTCIDKTGKTYPANTDNAQYNINKNFALSFTDDKNVTYKFDANPFVKFNGGIDLPAINVSARTQQVSKFGGTQYNEYPLLFLRNPFLGTWNSKTLLLNKSSNPTVVFNRDTTFTGYVINGQPQNNYSVNPPNSPLTSLFGDGYITGTIKGPQDNYDILYNTDLDTIYVFQKNVFKNPIDTLTR